MEKLFQALGPLGKSGRCGHEPAVPYGSLDNVSRRDTIVAPEMMIWSEGTRSHPCDAILVLLGCSITLTGVISPVKGVICWELRVDEVFLQPVKVGQLSLASIVGCRASVADKILLRG